MLLFVKCNICLNYLKYEFIWGDINILFCYYSIPIILLIFVNHSAPIYWKYTKLNTESHIGSHMGTQNYWFLPICYLSLPLFYVKICESDFLNDSQLLFLQSVKFCFYLLFLDCLFSLILLKICFVRILASKFGLFKICVSSERTFVNFLNTLLEIIVY